MRKFINKHVLIFIASIISIIVVFTIFIVRTINEYNPSRDSKVEKSTWVEPIGLSFQIDGKHCQAYNLINGILVDEKQWPYEQDIIGKFIKCDDQVINLRYTNE